MSGSEKECAKHSSAAGGQFSSSSASTASRRKLDSLLEGIKPKERHKLAVASPA